MTPAGIMVSREGAMRISTVYAAFRVISTTLASLPCSIYRRRDDGGKEIARDHRLYRVISRKPNPWQTAYRWRGMLEGHLMLRGNAYSVLRDGANGPGSEMWPLHPDRVRVLDQLNDGSLVYGWRPKAGGEVPLRQDQVLHLVGPSDDGLTGLSPLALMRNAIGLAAAAELYGSKLFANGAAPSLLLKHPNTLDPDAAIRLAHQVADRTSGENAHLPLVLEDGLDATTVALTNDEAQFIQTRDFQIGDLLRFLGVPGVLVGYADKTSTYASASEFFQSFVTNTMRPICCGWEQSLEQALLTEEEQDEFFIRFNLEALLRGNPDARAKFYDTLLRTTVLVPNEVRIMEDWNPREGGDEPLAVQGAALPPGLPDTQQEPAPSRLPPPEDPPPPKPRRRK